jgi:glutamate synthase domain-containing protein 2
MMRFIEQLRTLSGGKPTGFKLCIGHPWEWFAVCKAMLETGITPDFIVVDGAEGGTGAAPLEFTNHVGAPVQEGLLLVHNTLVGLGLRDHIKLGCAGKITSAFDIVRLMALGADWCNSARGFMFALGCIQAQACHTGHCPTGVTTQDAQRQRAINVPDKATRVASFHQNTLKALKELVEAAGLCHPQEITAQHIGWTSTRCGCWPICCPSSSRARCCAANCRTTPSRSTGRWPARTASRRRAASRVRHEDGGLTPADTLDEGPADTARTRGVRVSS